MIPLARLIKYGHVVPIEPPITAAFLMRAKDGIKDLASPSRPISVVGSIGLDATTVLPGQGYSYNLLQNNAKYFGLAVADTPDLNTSKQTGDFTIEFYAYIVATNSNYWYLSAGTGAAGGIKLFSGNMYLQAANGTGNLVSVSTIPVGRWIHCALVQEGTAISWYMDGVRKLTATGRWNIVNTPLRIGGYELAANAYLDQIRISNTALYSGTTLVPPEIPLY